MKFVEIFIKKTINAYQDLPLPAKASLWFFVCAIVEKVISFLTMPIFSRLLSTEQYGLVTLYYSWLGIVSIFVTLNLQYGSLATAQIKFEEKKYAYASAIQILVSCFTVIWAFFVICFSQFFEKIFQMSKALIIMLIIESWALFVIGLWRGNKRFDYLYKPILIVTLIIAFVSPMAGIFIVTQTTYKAEARLVAMFGVELLIGIILFIDILRKGRCIINRRYWKFALSFNIPIIPYYLSQIIFNVSDRIMISRLSGQDKAGIYGLVYTVAFVFDFVRTSLNSGYCPWYYRKIKEKDGKQVQLINERIMYGTLFLICVFILLGPELILVMGGEEYYKARWIVPPVAMSILFSFLTDNACNIEFYYEKKLSLVRATVMSAMLNIILNYVLISRMGYMVASYTTLVAYIVLWVCMYIGARKTCEKNGIDEKEFINMPLQIKIALCGIIMIPMMYILYQTTLLRYCVLVAIVAVCLLSYKKIVEWLSQCLG